MILSPTIGVFALQGDVREHVATLERLGMDVIRVRRESELERCDGLVIPGGESSTMCKLARSFEIFEPLAARIRSGMPTLGTCAGMIMLANRVVDGVVGQESFGGIDMTVRRNAFGRQVDSFETELEFGDFDEPVRAVFIRAPWVEEVGHHVRVLARVVGGTADGRIVAVQQGRVIATSFHPEVGNDDRIHQYFIDLVKQS